MRRLAINKRVSLAGIADGWTDDCYAIVSPATYGEYIDFSSLNEQGKSNAELVQYQIDFVKKHFVRGEVLVDDDQGSQVLTAMETEDIDASRAIADKLFAEVVGVAPDPKDSSTPMETSPTNEPSESTNS